MKDVSRLAAIILEMDVDESEDGIEAEIEDALIVEYDIDFDALERLSKKLLMLTPTVVDWDAPAGSFNPPRLHAFGKESKQCSSLGEALN